MGINVGAAFSAPVPLIKIDTLAYKKTSLLVNLMIGYQWNVETLFIAPELYGQFCSFKSNADKNPAFESELTQPWSIGLGMRFGIIFSHFSPYFKLGIGYAQFSHAFKELNILMNPGENPQTQTIWKTGFAIGGGAEFSLRFGLSVRLDYAWKKYPQFSSSFQKIKGRAFNLKADAARHTVTLGLFYLL